MMNGNKYTHDTSTERVKCVVGHLRAYGFDIQITDSCVGDLLESLAAERDRLVKERQEYRDIMHSAVLKIQDGAARHAEGMLIQALAEDCPNVLDNSDTSQIVEEDT